MANRVVAVVGRPNVGKSTLFNRLTGSRISIVEDTPGVTRDRIYHEVEWNGETFMLIDTGGIEPKTDSKLLVQMRDQAQIAIEHADVILFTFCAVEMSSNCLYGVVIKRPDSARRIACKPIDSIFKGVSRVKVIGESKSGLNRYEVWINSLGKNFISFVEYLCGRKISHTGNVRDTAHIRNHMNGSAEKFARFTVISGDVHGERHGVILLEHGPCALVAFALSVSEIAVYRFILFEIRSSDAVIVTSCTFFVIALFIGTF